jgi:pimeloyl-ACP methyl ester carboxylesterase
LHHQLLPYKQSLISCYRFGKGPQPVVCFHGYAEEGTMYGFLERYAGDQYTFLAIDLPFHGLTQWNEGLAFTHTDLQQIIKALFGRNDLPLPTSNLTLLGYSLGGRIALSLYQAWPGRIEKLVLLAPDGLKVNRWYRFTTRTFAGRRLFAFTMQHPGWFFGLLQLVNRVGLVNASVFKFVNYYIGDKQARLRLYQRWICLRKLKPDLQRIKNYIRQNKTPVRLLYGQHDRIILPVRGEKFKKGIEAYCTVKIIASGHQVLQEKHAAEITEALLH